MKTKIKKGEIEAIEVLYIKDGGYPKAGNFRDFSISELARKFGEKKAIEAIDLYYNWNN